MGMRWVTVCLLALGIAAGPGITARATEINQEEGIMPMHSAEYTRTLNRFASTDVDAAFYNPAGLAFMERKGLHAQFTSNTLYVQRISSMKYWGLIGSTPAGVFARLADTYVNNELGRFSGLPNKYTADIVAPCLPALDIVYNDANWAVFFDLHVTQAAPGLTFKEGLPILDWATLATYETLDMIFEDWTPPVPGFTMESRGLAQRNFAKRTEYYVAGTVGASYAFLDWLSAALGIRYIYAMANQTLGVRTAGVTSFIPLATGPYHEVFAKESPWLVDTDLKGHGAGLILGLHFKPIDIINIGIKYEYYFPMALDKHTNKFQASGTVVSTGQLNIFLDSLTKLPWWEKKDPSAAPYTMSENLGRMNIDTYKRVGKKLKVTYPQTLSFGFSVNILKGLRAETGGEVTFKPYVDLGGRQSNWDLGYRVGGALEWYFLEDAAVSVGYVYNDFGVKKTQKYELNTRKRNEIDPLLCSHTIGGGFKIVALDWLDVNLGANYMIFKKEKTDTMEYVNVQFPTLHFLRKKFDEVRWSIAIGLTAHLFGKSPKKDVDEVGILIQ